MKTLILLILILITPIITFSQDDVPNNSPDEAPLVNIPAGFWSSIGPEAGDVDYFKLEVTEPGVLEVLVNNYTEATGAAIAIEVTLLANDGITQIAYSVEGYVSFDVQKEFALCPGTYYLLINECYLTDNDAADPDLLYTNIHLNTNEITECNNCFAYATEVPIDTSFTTKIYGTNNLYPGGTDRDYFKVEVPVAGIMHIYIDNPSSLELVLKVYDDDTTTSDLASIFDVDAGPVNLSTYTVVCPRTYYFYIYSSEYPSYDSTSITVNIGIDTSEICECNNTFEEAMYVPMDTTFVTKMHGTNMDYGDRDYDIDYFYIVSPCYGQIEITVNNQTENTYGFYQVFYTDGPPAFSTSPSFPGNTFHNYFPGEEGDTTYFSLEYDYSVGYDYYFDTVLITVELHPYASEEIDFESDTSLCTGDSVMLFVVDPDADHYLWNTGDTTTSITINEAGSYWFTVFDDACILHSDTIDVSLHEIPTAIITPGGPLEFCEGDSVVLYGSGGDILDWIPGPIADSIVVDDNGTIQLKVTTDGCYDYASVYVEVYELPQPEIFTSDPTTFSIGDSALLFTTAIGDILWNTGLTTDTIIVYDAGEYFVEETDIHGCYGQSEPILIVNNPLPVPEITFAIGTFFCSTSESYQWNLDGTPLVGATEQTYIPTEFGSYSVTVMDANGCMGTSEEYMFLLEIPEWQSNIKIFPNPVIESLNIVFSNDLSFLSMDILNLQGEIVYSKILIGTSQIQLSNLMSGQYFIKLTDSDGNILLNPFTLINN